MRVVSERLLFSLGVMNKVRYGTKYSHKIQRCVMPVNDSRIIVILDIVIIVQIATVGICISSFSFSSLDLSV